MGCRKDRKTRSAPLRIWLANSGEVGQGDVGEAIPSDGQRQPQQENELEGVVEGEPVDNAEQTLKNATHVVSTDMEAREGMIGAHVKKEKTTQYWRRSTLAAI